MKHRCNASGPAYLLCTLLTACHPHTRVRPAIEFSKLPPASEGSPDKLLAIEGKAIGADSAERIVLFAHSGIWWVQPTAAEPFTQIAPDSCWKGMTHPGSAYAALLVDAKYQPPATLRNLPKAGSMIRAIAIAEGPALTRASGRTVNFSGYEWEARDFASDRGGTRNLYDPANTFVDKDGFLHLRITRKHNEWTCAEVRLTRSLGYGSYRFVVRDVSHLEPAAVFSVFTWDDSPAREMDLEISRWGERAGRNAQFVVQPYYVPANVVRFTAPSGVLTHSFKWDPGRVVFKTFRGSANPSSSDVVDEHTFTLGVPTAATEAVRMNLYRFDSRTNPMRNDCEVVIEKFEYLP